MRAKADSLRLPKKCFDILDEVARLRAACGRESVKLSEVPRDDAETLRGFSAGETRDVAGFDSPNMRRRLRSLKRVNFGILVDLYTLAFPGHELHRERTRWCRSIPETYLLPSVSVSTRSCADWIRALE